MKVFCIGFQKTGTSSLHLALKELGYEVCGTRSDLVEEIREGRMDRVWSEVEKFEAFEDHPWPNLFKELDARYPGSKFILTSRDADKWFASCERFFIKPHLVQEWNYGVPIPQGNKELWIDKYLEHNLEVREYFKKRPSDLLEVNWSEGHGWKELCEFLGHPIPNREFPKVNTKDDHWYKRSIAVARMLKWFPFLRKYKRIFVNAKYISF